MEKSKAVVLDRKVTPHGGGETAPVLVGGQVGWNGADAEFLVVGARLGGGSELNDRFHVVGSAPFGEVQVDTGMSKLTGVSGVWYAYSSGKKKI